MWFEGAPIYDKQGLLNQEKLKNNKIQREPQFQGKNNPSLLTVDTSELCIARMCFHILLSQDHPSREALNRK